MCVKNSVGGCASCLFVRVCMCECVCVCECAFKFLWLDYPRPERIVRTGQSIKLKLANVLLRVSLIDSLILKINYVSIMVLLLVSKPALDVLFYQIFLTI